MAKIKVPVWGGKQEEVRGTKCGRFFIHHPVHCDYRGAVWEVTHVATGMRFPWTFEKLADAKTFAGKVENVMDWSKVKVRIDNDKRKTAFVGRTPSKKERIAVHALAQKYAFYP